MQNLNSNRVVQSLPLSILRKPALNQSLPLGEPKLGLAQEAFSELIISGGKQQFLALLAPVLQSLSHEQADRWLTLVAPPETISNQWLRSIGVNPQKTMVISDRSPAKVMKILRQTLSLGLSHTVVSWIDVMPEGLKQQLSRQAAYTQSKWLNIKHPFTLAC
ncbi:cell division inhibitor SulA [Thiopseudomonas alkaliphila]|uniref:cell division inhibitor SulA n=1 Tax=Thiopseudomonas alkaliphila TaxID=1697053 RepID=UPI00069FDEBC|nr:SulA-like leucine-rich domain-containing protein [Thiopseudomonas alkaliphila]MDM1715698.1 CDP-glycerol--UDP-pyrophosphoryl-N-acetylglucosaminyl-N-acetylmannosamine glycerophosphotransferase [Thiopseudomonas alkaliphila]